MASSSPSVTMLDRCFTPHAIMVPLPESGHINPLMHLATYLASNGILVTFVNTEYNHQRILQCNKNNLPSDRGLSINLVSVYDGLQDQENRDTDITNFVKIMENLPDALCALISKLNSQGPHVTCIISDVIAGSSLDVAKKFGIPRVGFWPPTVAAYAWLCHGIAGSRNGSFPVKGVPEEDEITTMARLPQLSGSKMIWRVGTKENSEGIFETMTRNIEALQQSEWTLCNSVLELEIAAVEDMPKGFPRISTVGPVLPSHFLHKKYFANGSNSPLQTVIPGLWSEDLSCIEWLDKQETKSVLYVSVGSIAILNREQLLELAYGLEETGLSILWTVRQDMMNEEGLPQDFLERNRDRIRLVTWAPQLLVLSHDAVGGFLTHNGWNSVIEAMSMGVPMLSWPHLVDQFLNSELVVKQWGVGIELDVKGYGLVRRDVVSQRVMRLMKGDEVDMLRSNALAVRDAILKAVDVGGSSYNHLNQFLKWLKQQKPV